MGRGWCCSMWHSDQGVARMPCGHRESVLTRPQGWQGAFQTRTWELGPGQDKKERGEEINYGASVGGTDGNTVGRKSPRGWLQACIEGSWFFFSVVVQLQLPPFFPVKGVCLPVPSMETFLKKSGRA